MDKVRSIKDWYAYYYLDYEKENGEGKLFIKLPLLNLDSLDQYRNLKANLYLNDGRIQTRPLEIRGNDYNPHINSLELCVQGLLGGNIEKYHFRITVEDSTGVIFDSLDSLYRDVILFDDFNRKECKDRFINPRDHQTMLAYCPQPNVSTSFDALAKGSKGPGPFEISPSENDVILLNDGKRIIFVDSKGKSTCRVLGDELIRLKLDNKSVGLCNVFRSVQSIEIGKSFVFYQSGTILNVLIENIGKDGIQYKTRLVPYAGTPQTEKYILLSCEKYPELNENGLHRVSLIDIAGKKTIATISYFLQNISFECEGDRLCVNESTYIKLEIPGEENLTKYCNVTEEEVRHPTGWGTFLIDLPRLKYRIEGYKDRLDEFLSLDPSGTKTSHFIAAYSSMDGAGDFLSLSDVQLCLQNFYKSGVNVYVNENEVPLKDGCYAIGPLLAKSKHSANVYIEIFHYKCLICTVYREEFVNPKGVDLSFDETGFHYSINGFVGENPHYFLFRIYDDEGFSKETEPFADLAGSFDIEGFTPGYFHYSLYRMNYGAGWIKGKKLFDTASIGGGELRELGDVVPLMFENKKLCLMKVPSLGKLRKTFLEKIKFVSYGDFGEPLFQGYLNLPGKKRLVAYFVPDSRALRLYRDKNKVDFFFYDKKERTLCDGKKTNDCEAVSSIYYEEQEG